MQQFMQKNKMGAFMVTTYLFIGLTSLAFQNEAFSPIQKFDQPAEISGYSLQEKPKEPVVNLKMEHFDNILLSVDKKIQLLDQELDKLNLGELNKNSINQIMKEVITEMDKAKAEWQVCKTGGN